MEYEKILESSNPSPNHSPVGVAFASIDRRASARDNVIIISATLLAHFMALGRGFVWDDEKTFDYLNSTGSWRLFVPDPFGFIRPGKIFLFSLLNSLFGENPWPYEIVAMVIVAITGIALIGLLRYWLSPIAALFATLVYVCHPHHVETSFWISALNGGILTLLGILYYRVVISKNDCLSVSSSFGISALYFVALSMKEEAVVFPLIASIVLVSLGRWPSRRFILISAMHLTISGGYVLYCRHVARELGQTLGIEEVSGWILSLSAPRMMLSHFIYFLFPFRWGYYRLFSLDPSSIYAMMALGLVAAVIATLWLSTGSKLRSPAKLGLAIAIVAMLPVSNIVPMGNNWWGVRYLSHSGIGLVLILGAALDHLIFHYQGRQRLAYLAGGIWLVLAAFASNLHHTSWTTSAEFFERTLSEQRKDEEGSTFLLLLLANERLRQGQVEDALALSDEAIEKDPDRLIAYLTKGIALSRLGRKEEALSVWKRAEEINPADVENAIQLGFYYDERHEQSSSPDDLERADYYYQIATNGPSPNAAVAFANRGLLWMMEGDYDKAVAIWEEGNRRFPAYAGIQTNLERSRKDPRAKKRGDNP